MENYYRTIAMAVGAYFFLLFLYKGRRDLRESLLLVQWTAISVDKHNITSLETFRSFFDKRFSAKKMSDIPKACMYFAYLLLGMREGVSIKNLLPELRSVYKDLPLVDSIPIFLYLFVRVCITSSFIYIKRSASFFARKAK